MSKPTTKLKVDEMSEDDLLDELRDIIRASKVKQEFVERKRFRQVATKLKSLGFKLTP